jgi:hypothetical protein
MRRIATLALLALAAACTGRQVEVGTGPETAAAAEGSVSVRVSNSLAQAVNVYVVTNGQEAFVGQVAAQSTQLLTVRGVAAGTTATLRAREVDGRRTYERENVSLAAGTLDWRVP